MTKDQSKPPHIPVMLSEILENFGPQLAMPCPGYLDCTLGRGGHMTALFERNPQMQLVGLDRDPAALEYVSARLPNAELVHTNFANYDLKPGSFDMILADLGVSSPQLDEGHRGFSMYNQGPLDMRMDPTQELTAAQLLAELDEDDLNRVFQEYGEIPKPYRVVRAVVHDRKLKAFESTTELAGLIERVEGWRKKGFHPATPYFMALRLVVNRELESLQQALPKLMLGLKPKGRLCVLTFHSLEDRIVKNEFKNHPEWGEPLFKKVIKPTDEEIKLNSRSRSAKLRVFERSGDEAQKSDQLE